jgi:hypothetical protein
MNTITDIIKELEESPMFYLFSSSKELFHSNFWYWLYTINPHEMLRLFSDAKVGDFTVERELQTKGKKALPKTEGGKNKKAKAILDLAFIEASQTLKIIVENKVKDFPQKDQLERIQAACDDVNGEKYQYVLTTLFTFEGMNFDKWKTLTYKEIADKIEPEKFTPNNTYHQALIGDYKEFLKNLANLAEALHVTHDYDFAISHHSKKEENLFHALNKIKLWEVYSKMRSSHLIAEFQKKFSENREFCSSSYHINNQKATLHFIKHLSDTNYSIGVQIEGIQFRRFVSVKDASTGKIHQFAENLKREGLFLNSEFENKKDKSSFGNYGNNFRYQYAKINSPIEKPISFQKLFELIEKEFQEIEDNKPEILICIPQ